MPVLTCQKDGKSGHKFGPKGVCFTGSNSRAKAESVGRAIAAQGTEKRMDRLQALKDIASGQPVQKSANLAELMEIGMLSLMLHNVLHNRTADDDGPEFDKSDMDGLFGAVEMALHGGRRRKKPKEKALHTDSGTSKDGCPEGMVLRDGQCVDKSLTKSFLDQLKTLITKAEDSCCDVCENTQISTAPPIGELIAKSIDQDKGLVTAVILRPNVADLHGDIYDAAEVEKACFNFNTRCGQTSIQHEELADFQMVESFIVKADSRLGEGEVLSGDWIGTMHIDPSHSVWTQIKSGEFTGFSVGCKATVETI